MQAFSMFSAPSNFGVPIRLLKSLLLTNVLVFFVIGAVAFFCQQILNLSEMFLWKVSFALVVGGLLVLILAIRYLPSKTFGLANQITMLRGSLVALLFGLIADHWVPWLVVITCSVILILDGVDGWIARRSYTDSSFGARFDMEIDALLLLVLSSLVWQYEKAGVWVFLAGLMRYIFIISSRFFPFLSQPLPPRRRRQTAFVFQAIALIVCISPVFVQPLSSMIALAGFMFLSISFSIDVIFLSRQTR